MPKIPQWLSALPNPLAKLSNVSSHCVSIAMQKEPYSFVQAAGFTKKKKTSLVGFHGLCLDTTELYTHTYTHAPTLLTAMHTHMWGNSKLEYKKENVIDQCASD